VAGDGSRGHPVFAAAYAWGSGWLEGGRLGAARRELLAQARGVVLDLGAGIGANLPHLGPAVSRVHLVEPDPHMVRRLRPRVPRHGVVHQTRGESLPLDDASVDTVLATLTLCSVDDPPAVLAELRRVLRSGGRVLVLEHVLSDDPGLARRQLRYRRPWQVLGAGCRPDRDTAAALAEAGFDVAGLRRFQVRGSLLAAEWVTGSVG